MSPATLKIAARALGTTVVVAGLWLLISAIRATVSGELADGLFPGAARSWSLDLMALALRIPVPLHVISIGLVLQKRWLPRPWDRAAFIAVASSGMWLGATVLVRWLL